METDPNDKPVNDIKIIKAEVFFDPFSEIDEEREEERLQKEEKQREKDELWDDVYLLIYLIFHRDNYLANKPKPALGLF